MIAAQPRTRNQIIEEIHMVARYIQAPVRCLNTDTDFCCEETLDGRLSNLIHELGYPSVWWQSDLGHQVPSTEDARRDRLPGQFWFRCRFQEYPPGLVTDALGNLQIPDEAVMRNFEPFWLDVDWNYIMECHPPFVPHTQIAHRAHSENVDSRGVCVNERSGPAPPGLLEVITDRLAWYKPMIVTPYNTVATTPVPAAPAADAHRSLCVDAEGSSSVEGVPSARDLQGIQMLIAAIDYTETDYTGSSLKRTKHH